jgi:hypothetical protein
MSTPKTISFRIDSDEVEARQGRRSPFIIDYEVSWSADTLTVITVFDGRRRWPEALPKE